jgi:Protein of unknown function (DUF1573)
MKLSILLLALLPLAANAGLKWESTRKVVAFKAGTPVYRVEFPFRNTGKTNVIISEIQTGCACCTTAKVKKRDYAPGESGTVQMMVDVRGKDVPLAKSVLVQFADQSTPTPLIVEVKTADGKTVSVPRWNISFRK